MLRKSSNQCKMPQKQNRIILFLLIPLAIAGFWFLRNKNTSLPQFKIGNAKLEVEIADSPLEQVSGLSNRDNLPENRGMLFVFDKEDLYPFWMKDMRFAIDIIWIDGNGAVIGIEYNIEPATFPNSFMPPRPVKYVLEVNAGWASKNSIKVADITDVLLLAR